MLKIRLQRVGRRHEPSFRVIVTESTRGPKSGDFIEILGNHNPKQKEMTQLKADRIKYWISKGAQVSGIVHNLLITHGVIEGKKINVLPKKTPQIPEKSEEESKEKKTEEKSEEKNEEIVSEEKDKSETEEVKEKTESENKENSLGEDSSGKEDVSSSKEKLEKEEESKEKNEKEISEKK
jgi:small subunit ribosomal protein S16